MITSVRLQNFRSYKDSVFELQSGVTIVVGPNASGKTNLLESLYFSYQGRGFRGKDVNLLATDAEWLRVDASIKGTEPQAFIFKQPSGQQRVEKEYRLDGEVKKRLHHTHKRPVTLFEPEHMRLLVGSPELRRGYMDAVITQAEPRFITTLNTYKRILAQRNRLLKEQPTDMHDQIFVWNVRLGEAGSRVVSARKQLLDYCNERTADIYGAISARPSTLEFAYSSTIESEDYESGFLHRLTTDFDLDILRGFTGSGPHRDDMRVSLNNKDAHTTASRGESRSIVLTAKIIEMQRIFEATGTRPLLLLDDVFSELDGARRRALTEHLKDHQTVITTTDADAIVKHFMADYGVIATG